jgi:Carbamoyl-phosphate synthase L chain, ATP binding domain
MQPENIPVEPKVLLVTTRRWFSAARLSMAFAASGCRVEIACPSGHPAMLTRSISARYPFRALWPSRSLHSAIRKSQPDLVVPTDEVAANYLHQLYEQAPFINAGTAPSVRLLLERSLGEPESFPFLSSRASLLAVAQAQGITTPSTVFIGEEQALRQWLSENPLPAVLKADGTSGGEGVEIVCTQKQAFRAWSKLRAPFGLARVVKKTGFEHDPHHIVPWILRRPRAVSIQPFIPGREANISLACWRGEILGSISLDVLRVWRPKGPSVLVELTRNDDMLYAARTMIRKLNLSGLCGFDFIIEHATNRTYLIEMNARATQACHLSYGAPRDLIPSLVSAVAMRPLPILNEAPRRGIISLFPLAWHSGIPKEVLDSTLQDIPREEPQLVKAGFAQEPQSLYEKCMGRWNKAHAPKPLAGASK